MKLELDNWVLSRLAEPFPVEDLKWLPAFGLKQGKPAPVLVYVDARTIAERLNEVVGANNWSDSYHTVGVETEVVKSEGTGKDRVDTRIPVRYGGVQCDLTILGVTKSDVGTPSYSDELKGGYSDALKRAAVKFGIGEYFYRMGTLFAEHDGYRITKAPTKLPDFAYPIERANPDEVIKNLIAEFTVEHVDYSIVRELIRHVTVMGSYNPNSPLIVKRAVYEGLLELKS